MNRDKIYKLIPQREPFLFLDTIDEINEKKIQATYQVTGQEFFSQGHFPENPIVPGVILQEACFQAGAALMSQIGGYEGLGVVSRVQDVKFKKLVVPKDILNIEVELNEVLSNAFFMIGKISIDKKVVMQVKFTGALIQKGSLS